VVLACGDGKAIFRKCSRGRIQYAGMAAFGPPFFFVKMGVSQYEHSGTQQDHLLDGQSI
jgi:hypothetical protein